MSSSLIDRSPDLQRLRDDGYALCIVAGHLLVSEIPCVGPSGPYGGIARGRLVVQLELAGDRTVRPTRHQAWWAGPGPCDANGRDLHNVAHQRREAGIGVAVDRMLCVKPSGREFVDYHELVTTYIALISAHAKAVDPSMDARVNSHILSVSPADNTFRYVDTATSRAGIGKLSKRLEGGSVGIVGLGGTGSYVLDLVAKSPVSRIHLFDGDTFDQHNAFRAPGAPSLRDLKARRMKVDHFAGIYSRMHCGIVTHPVSVSRSNIAILDEADFVFVCIDDASAKRTILDHLAARSVEYVDVGLGLVATDDGLAGAVRVTVVTKGGHETALEYIPMGARDDPYATNIQIADLNALNAALAVIEWKRLRGFYAARAKRTNSIYVVGDGSLHVERAP